MSKQTPEAIDCVHELLMPLHVMIHMDQHLISGPVFHHCTTLDSSMICIHQVYKKNKCDFEINNLLHKQLYIAFNLENVRAMSLKSADLLSDSSD